MNTYLVFGLLALVAIAASAPSHGNSYDGYGSQANNYYSGNNGYQGNNYNNGGFRDSKRSGSYRTDAHDAYGQYGNDAGSYGHADNAGGSNNYYQGHNYQAYQPKHVKASFGYY